MSSYRVVAPVGFTRDGGGVSAWPGVVVEVDDDQGKALVKSGHLELVKEEPVKAVKPKAES